MGDSPQAAGALQSVQAGINITRDALFLSIILMLLFWPMKMNKILSDAGFTHGSVMGWDWVNKFEHATQQTEAAQEEVERLHSQLGDYANRMDQVANSVAQPAVKAQALELARGIRNSQTVADGVRKSLATNAAVQRDLRNQLKNRVQ
jgi:hypothetical protein